MEVSVLAFPTKDLHEDPQWNKDIEKEGSKHKAVYYTQDGVSNSGVGDCPEATRVFPF